MVAPASPVPVIVGVGSFTCWPCVGAVITGATGTVLSTRNVLVFEAGDTVPATFVATANTVWLPSASCGDVSVKVPFVAAVTVPARLPSTYTRTLLPPCVVPASVGVLEATTDPSAGWVTTGAGTGATEVSTVKLTGVLGGHVPRRVGLGGGDRVRSVGEREDRGVGPGAVAGDRGRPGDEPVEGDRDGRSRLARAGDGRRRVTRRGALDR